MTSSDLDRRLRALTEAVSSSAVRFPPPASADQAVIDGADAQRVATSQVDELLRRVGALTTVLGSAGAHDWDEIDQLAARLLLADLAVVTATTRALNDLAAGRLATAHADLVAARRHADAALRDPA